ncbi:hypothetical protein G647_00810 [Cladophialophora carrionii CBS 160.54]|uniref:Uncharacterized protein n=1 Tax=Cladophialophora carrionii CBS 160.54 TaxID=1279043 RepID=V9DNZ4_9EURO|nr:uncharacterized protein G647_00810 [Cladophialophora carrionii CBS 160.54]ETI28361.1 hypothetical protein G647_00810 [Cladophialophora carrionii CBS 160.54]
MAGSSARVILRLIVRSHETTSGSSGGTSTGDYRAFLVKHSNVELKCYYQPDEMLGTDSLAVYQGVPALFRRCKRVEDEGTDVLYGDNTFECYHVRVFQNHFIHGRCCESDNRFRGIGRKNAAKIKKACFGLPLVITRYLQDSFAGNAFLDLICADLMVRIRALLTTVSRIGKYHPTLRKAIWRRWSGSRSQALVIAGDTYVDLVALGFEARFEGSVIRKNAWGEDVESFDLLLRTSMIRSTSWLDNSVWNDVHNFEIDKSLITAKVDESEMSHWPGAVEYEPLLELSPSDQAAMVGIIHGRIIHCLFIRGGFIDGKFVKGYWFGQPPASSRFFQGNFIPTRMVDGALCESQFVEGQWVNDEEFVEGKWLDGRLIKGVWVTWHAEGDGKFFEGKWRDGLFTKGRWVGEGFIEGMWAGSVFYEGKWTSQGAFLRGSWVKKPDIPGLVGAGL